MEENSSAYYPFDCTLLLEYLQHFPFPDGHSYFFVITEKTFSNSSPSQVVIYPKFGKRASTSSSRIRGTSVLVRRGERTQT
jgi:hypothetical protein